MVVVAVVYQFCAIDLPFNLGSLIGFSERSLVVEFSEENGIITK
jgi:hypothetical protein